MKKSTILTITILLTLALVTALSFTSAPTINEGNDADTTETLLCEWTSSGDTTSTNVTWYVNGTEFKNTVGASSPNSISSANTTRGDTWECLVSISNGTSIMNSSDNITIVNADPGDIKVYNESSVDIGNSTTIDEDVSRTFDVNSTDPDGDPVTFSTQNLPDGASFNSNTGILTWTPNASQVGTHNVTFIALDDQSPDKGSTAEDVIFTVEEVNDNPEFDPVLTNQTATEGQSFSYTITVTDEESDFPINFTIDSDIDDLIINRTSNTTADVLFSDGTPGFEDRGNHTVTVNITDSRDGNNTGTFNLEVTPVNEAPNLSQIPNASGTQGQPFELIINATDREVNDTLTFNIAAVSCSIANPWTITKITEVTQNNESFANATINSSALTNDHVICTQINVSVTDSKETDYQIVDLNITNVNDAPVLHQNSSDPSNTDNQNITNQTAYANAQYTYQVNSSDIDSQTQEGEVLNHSDNTTLFNITSSGLIQFTPVASQIGNYSINITVSDDSGASDTQIMNLVIKNNSAPNITDPGAITCQEDQLCTKFINATDADNDNITFSSNDTSIFNITDYNATSGLLNFTYNQSQVGNYSINVTATDTRGAKDSAVFTFTVNNSNDDPVLDPITFPTPIVATHPVRVDVTADDEDIQLFGGSELLNYSDNSTIFNISTSFDNSTNTSTGIIQFTPTTGQVGDYSVNISVSDPQNATDYQIVNFTVLNDTDAPNISQINPYGQPVANSTNFSFINTSLFPGTNTTVNVSENTTVLFNHTTTDDTTPLANLTYEWFVNGSSVTTSRTYTRSFNFFSSGIHEVLLRVSDERLENSTWLWIVNVTNLNRPPVLHNDLENVTIDSTETFSKYLELRSNAKFVDPDDDVDGNLEIGANETNRLSFTHSTCSVANITITNSDVKFRPTEVGNCTMTFTAEDPEGASLQSNDVFVNVTAVPNGTTTTETETVTVTTSSGGGGGGSASTVIPQEVEVEEPHPLNIIAPEEVTLYRNRTITIPVLLENTWNNTITDVELGASTNNTEVEWEFEQDFFPSIESGERHRTSLTVTGYRLGENFEMVINASVGEPEFQDNALVLFNSIEQRLKGDEVQIMVTFARDLLTQNEECQELGELLNEAESSERQGDYNRAANILDTVINGCKYLMSETRVRQEEPSRFDFGFVQRFNWFYLGAGALLISLIAAIVVIEMRIRKENSEQE